MTSAPSTPAPSVPGNRVFAGRGIPKATEYPGARPRVYPGVRSPGCARDQVCPSPASSGCILDLGTPVPLDMQMQCDCTQIVRRGRGAHKLSERTIPKLGRSCRTLPLVQLRKQLSKSWSRLLLEQEGGPPTRSSRSLPATRAAVVQRFCVVGTNRYVKGHYVLICHGSLLVVSSCSLFGLDEVLLCGFVVAVDVMIGPIAFARRTGAATHGRPVAARPGARAAGAELQKPTQRPNLD